MTCATWPVPGGLFTDPSPPALPASIQLGGVPGFRDLLPEEAEVIREAQESLLAEMRRWGYRHVITPMIESTNVLDLGLGSEQRRRLFKFTDSGGDVVALVGERTVPVARLVAGKLRSTALPVRLCYAGPVLSADAGRFHQRRETYQVGAELIGARGAIADAEVIALAARCLEAAGLRRFQVDVGHAEFFQGIMDAVKLPDAVKAGVRSALAARDFVALEDLLSRTALRSAEHELLLRFPALRGGPEILDAAAGLVRNRRSEWALNELGRVRHLLESHGLGDIVRLDLGAIRDFDYYTGIIFEGYGPDLGRPVAQGGRYDGLLAKFGRPAAATGFVVQLDLVWEMLSRGPRPPAPPRLDAAIAWTESGFEAALRLGSTLRLFGMHAVVDTQPRDHDDALAWCRAIGAANLVHCRNSSTVAWTVPGRRTKQLPPEQVAARLAGTGR
ncbi:MAG: ATP phosphoribosyltransferase regulatory subunit [Chloroflexi bacterium]|nr:MAG: ATP phosphoribosyltransferase regulatory subunit [Chloroflexota bacterium]TMF07240.1 MAG: ATP phosphoribosyltransferase regulatory subunit [Chloroflexota bacterium]